MNVKESVDANRIDGIGAEFANRRVLIDKLLDNPVTVFEVVKKSAAVFIFNVDNGGSFALRTDSEFREKARVFLCKELELFKVTSHGVEPVAVKEVGKNFVGSGFAEKFVVGGVVVGNVAAQD